MSLSLALSVASLFVAVQGTVIAALSSQRQFAERDYNYELHASIGRATSEHINDPPRVLLGGSGLLAYSAGSGAFNGLRTTHKYIGVKIPICPPR